MKRIELDYLASPSANRAGIAMLVAGLCCLVTVGWYYRQLDDTVTQQQAQLSKLQQRLQIRAAPVETRSAEQSAIETKLANAVILALALPWKEFFDAFEASAINDVAVLAIEPDASHGLVRITAESKKLESMLNYSTHLQKIALFREVLIQSHQIQEQDPEKPIRFVLQAAWETQP